MSDPNATPLPPNPAQQPGNQQFYDQSAPETPVTPPAYGQPQQPTYGQPYEQGQPTAYGQAPYAQPVYGQGQPAYGQPSAYGQNPYSQPAYGQPQQPAYGQGQPVYGQPMPVSYGQPPYGQPAQVPPAEPATNPEPVAAPTAAPTAPTAPAASTASNASNASNELDDDSDATVLGSIHAMTPAADATPEANASDSPSDANQQPGVGAPLPEFSTPQTAPGYGQSAQVPPYGGPSAIGNPYAPAGGPAPAPAFNQANGLAPMPGTNIPYGAPTTGQYAYTAAEPSLDEPYYGCPIFTAFARFWRKYVVFSGRASRSEFWWVALCNAIIIAIFGIATGIIYKTTNVDLGFIITLYQLAALIPTLSLSVRRLHDIDKPGWWMAIIYGSFAVAAILGILGGASFLIGGLGSLSGGGSGYGVAAAGGGILFIIGGLLDLAMGILYIVLMATPSKPEGARFDKIPAGAAPYGAPMTGTAAPYGAAPTAGNPYDAAPAPGAPAPFGVPVPPRTPDPNAAPAPTPQQPDDEDDDMDATVLGSFPHNGARQ